MLHPPPQQQLQRSDTRIVRKQAPPPPTDALETFKVTANNSSNQARSSSAESTSKSDFHTVAAFSKSNKPIPIPRTGSTEFQSLKLGTISKSICFTMSCLN